MCRFNTPIKTRSRHVAGTKLGKTFCFKPMPDTRLNICWATNVVTAVQKFRTVYHVMLNVEVCHSTCWNGGLKIRRRLKRNGLSLSGDCSLCIHPLAWWMITGVSNRGSSFRHVKSMRKKFLLINWSTLCLSSTNRAGCIVNAPKEVYFLSASRVQICPFFFFLDNANSGSTKRYQHFIVRHFQNTELLLNKSWIE